MKKHDVMNSTRTKLIIAGIFGFLAVAIGAFGAHGLKSILSEKMIQTYNTGVLYHLVHSVVLLALVLADKMKFNKSFYMIMTGIILFSFSLYIYAITGITFLAMITPFGGVCFLIGWGMIIKEGIK